MNTESIRQSVRHAFAGLTSGLRPLVQFFGVDRVICDVVEIAHDACEPGRETCEPQSPSPRDTVIVTLDLFGHQPGEGVTVSIGTERALVGGIGAQLEVAGRKLREVGKSWKRVAVCRICSTHAFDADNPPPTGHCPNCRGVAMDIEELEGGAAELRTAASGDCRVSFGMPKGGA